MNCLVVIPARGGSKRIPNKNRTMLAGIPLITHTLNCVRNAGLIDITVVSTDDADISQVAKSAGFKVISRPEYLATDGATTESVLLHAIDQHVNAGNTPPEWVMTLPPTSPLRLPSTVLKFFEQRQNTPKDVDCVMSVTENRGDFWFYDNRREFKRLFPQAPRRQQDRSPLYEENSAIYITRVPALRKTKLILGNTVVGMPISHFEALDINIIEDLELAEAIILYRKLS